jgi:hypothetical protein
MKFKRHGYECWLIPKASVIHYREKSLQTLSFDQRSTIRWHAVLNICDAFIVGWARIISDKLSGVKNKIILKFELYKKN